MAKPITNIFCKAIYFQTHYKLQVLFIIIKAYDHKQFGKDIERTIFYYSISG